MQAEGHLKRLKHRRFPVKFLRKPFLQNTSGDCFCFFGGCFCIFLKKAILQPCYDVLIIFYSRHIVWCIKSQTRLFINLSSIIKFSKQLRQSVTCKAKNWHAWSHEQCFSKHRFLDICRCAFKDQNIRYFLNIHVNLYGHCL